jgi:hypothetical protein
MAAVCALISGLGLYKGSSHALIWLGAAAVFAGLTLWRPHSLSLANRAWLKLGLLMYRVVNPVIMAILFYSGRIQTVHAGTNARFHELLAAFKAATGCPVLVNTSFNVRGEPIVCTPEDAFRCFMGSDIEVLVVGNCFLKKEEQPLSLKLDYKNMFELD